MPLGKILSQRKATASVSAHFTTTDFMIRPNSSGVWLKNLAVPSIFYDLSDECDVSTNVTPAMQFSTTSMIEPDTTVIESDITPTMEFETSVDTIKMPPQKKKKVMNSSLIKLKRQEISPRKKRMLRIIKTLKQKLKRKEEKINSLENLLKHLRYENPKTIYININK